MKKWMGQALCFALALVGILGAAALAADAGSQQDPLVTLSYLNDTYLPGILSKVDEKLEERDTGLAQALAAQIEEMEKDLDAKYGSGASSGAAAVYTVVTLSQGQVLAGQIGCEVMLRIGTAVCVADTAPGLVDTTAGSTLNGGGALVPNHLYLMTIEGRGVKATAGTVKLLVRGSYVIV